MKEKAVCLFSGGLDSTTVLYQAISQGYEVTALTIRYGQSHERELESAKQLVDELAISHFVTSFSLPWGGSALLDKNIPLPKGRSTAEMSKDIPVSYVPARNSIFLSLAGSLADAQNLSTIFIGANILDYSGYPDCRPDYLRAFEEMLRLGTKAGEEGNTIQIKAPLLRLNKKEIIQLGQSLKVPYEKTWSCYEGGKVPCGSCDSCQLRAKGFEEAGLKDPLITYATSS